MRLVLIEMHRTHLIFCPVLEVLAAGNRLDKKVLQLVVAVAVEKDGSWTNVGGTEKTKGWWRRWWRGGGAVEAEHHSWRGVTCVINGQITVNRKFLSRGQQEFWKPTSRHPALMCVTLFLFRIHRRIASLTPPTVHLWRHSEMQRPKKTWSY